MGETRWRESSLRASFPTARPFLKWAGGKGQLVERLRRYIPLPSEGNTYFEPFLGAGAIFFALQPSRAVLSDTNRPLMETYAAVKTRVNELLRVLSELSARPDSDEYYARRREFNELIPSVSLLSPQERTRMAALFIWLNHTCYNGLYRVNRSGLFNVPFGFVSNPTIFDEANVRAASRALNRGSVSLQAIDYRKALSRVTRGDVVYLDPPYDPEGLLGGFTEYTPGGFDRVDQAQLAVEVRQLVHRGSRVILSNSSTPRIEDLYAGFEIHKLTARRAISCVGKGRGKVKEMVVIG